MPKRADVCDQLPAKQDEDSEGYERLISILPEWMAMIVRLRIEHNMTMPRVANVIGVSKWNAWDLERRALKQLRTHLENP